ncbi:M24 family metallopeptidase [Sphingomonas glaciei]|uniref:Xaa-Pro aminopeptidase n=1 Tax=Sphingomonas glaciei TaxID=2938948 RepID=A0ABY5MTD9_9SPHN|nr:Xaa-Pro peptidase family protein [Sphingomonas glaciei]UUR07775.1 Xaa-Pro peptidase family protein [Sphingomonas glaciei]
MIGRRSLLAGMAATGAALPLQAQVFPPSGYGTPIATSPFPPEVFAERRRKVMAKLGGGIAVVFGAKRGGGDSPVEAPFFQDPDFAWLTGITDEPGAVLVLAPAERRFREYLLLPSRNPEAERWERERLPLGAEIERRSGFARVMRTSNLGALVTGLAERFKEFHFFGPVVGPDSPVPASLELYGKVQQRIPGVKTTDSSKLLTSIRMVKEARELDLITKALAATARGHLAGMTQVQPGWTEGRLKDVIEAGFKAGGADGLAYSSIVGSGRNAASLHYVGNGGAVRAGDMILVDAGASLTGYATDITRTYPASGRFTPKQRSDYELVLQAQEAAASRLRAGVYYEDLQEAARDVFRRDGRIDQFTHGLGHHVGLHVHDAADYSQPIPAGAVMTIEPGLYLQDENYGIRIEDMYLVTATGAQRMSTAIPRTVAEIERAMAR